MVVDCPGANRFIIIMRADDATLGVQGGGSQLSDSLHQDDIRRKGFVLRKACGCEHDMAAELLEYDYNYDDSSRPPQQLPRIRERGEYYVDSYNGEPWNCSFGTAEEVSLKAPGLVGVASIDRMTIVIPNF